MSASRYFMTSFLCSLISLFASLPSYCLADTKAATRIDLVSPLAASSAQLRFHEGKIANNQPLMDPVLPAVPGPASNWALIQWNHTDYLNPASLRTYQAAGQLPYYESVAADLESMLFIRHDTTEAGLVFTLWNSNGTVTTSGGRALYLSAGVLPNVDTGFNNDIVLALDARVSHASASYTFPTAKATGAVLAMAYTGLGLMFTDPSTRAQQFVFMQVGLTQSNASNVTSGYICSGSTVVLFAPPVPASAQLPFQSDGGPLHHLTFDVSAAVQAMVSKATPCIAGHASWTPTMLNLANWHLAGAYVGSETENTDARPGAVTKLPQGTIALGLDLANLSIRSQ